MVVMRLTLVLTLFNNLLLLLNLKLIKMLMLDGLKLNVFNVKTRLVAESFFHLGLLPNK